MDRFAKALTLCATLSAASVVPVEILAQDDSFSSASKVKMYVVSDRLNVEPGSQVRLAVMLDHEPYWHTYAHGSPVALEQDLITVDVAVTPDPSQLAVHAEKTGWPKSKVVTFSYGGPPVDLEVYEGRAIVYVPITVNMAAAKGPVEIPVTAKVQACDDKTCLAPADLSQSITLNIVALSEAQTTPDHPEIFSGFPEEVWATLAKGPARASHPHGKDPTLTIVLVAVGITVVVVAYIWAKFAR